MALPSLDELGRLRADWLRAWPEAAADAAQRDAMVDVHVRLHAMTRLVGEGLDGPPPDLGLEVADRSAVVRDLLAGAFPRARVRSALAVMAPPGQQALRVERSRPGWHLSGVVPDVVWSDAGGALVVCAVDEGDNEVVALVPVSSAGTEVGPVRRSTGGRLVVDVAFDDVAVPDTDLVHAAGARDLAADLLTLVDLSEVVVAAGTLPAGERGQDELDELALCGAAVRSARRAATGSGVLARHHDVSAAAVIVPSVCARLLDERGSGGILVARLDEHELRLATWHRQRLVPLL